MTSPRHLFAGSSPVAVALSVVAMTTVVLVSGGAAVSPFTTPDAAATTGLAAGNSLTFLRRGLLDAGHRVFTAPARLGPGTVVEDAGWQGFSDVPEVLPAAFTIDAVGTIDAAGGSLARFLGHLVAEHGVTDVALVGHSMGGLFSRAALHRLRTSGTVAPDVTRLVTVGTPWTGALLGDFVTGAISLEDAGGDETTRRILTEARAYAEANSRGAAEQVAVGYLAGADGWNERHVGELDGIPVTVIAGDRIRERTEPPALWPHDGLVATRSASAADVPTAVLPHAEKHVLDDVHSIFFAEMLGLPWNRALTWDPRVLAIVAEAVGEEA